MNDISFVVNSYDERDLRILEEILAEHSVAIFRFGFSYMIKSKNDLMNILGDVETKRKLFTKTFSYFAIDVTTNIKDNKMKIITSDFFPDVEVIKELSPEDFLNLHKPEIESNLDLDSILDKISQYGMESLNTDELEFLKTNS